MYELSPSLLSADFTKLGEEIREVEQGGARYLHIDVMDGNFVPCISFGMPVIKCIRPVTQMVFDIHLMIEKPERYIKDLAECGADIITIHAEACSHLDRVIQQIRDTGKRVGVSLNPATPLCVLDYVLDKVDMVLVMTVNPGFGGQKYLESCTVKIQRLREMIQDRGLQVDIEVDGGINDETIHTVLRAGANVIVAGSSVFDGNTGERVTKYLNVIKEYEV